MRMIKTLLRFFKNTFVSGCRIVLYVIELIIMMQIFRLSYVEAGATDLTNRDFYYLLPMLLTLSALYGMSLNTTTTIRQSGILSPNIIWIVLILFLGITYDIPALTGALSSWMIVHSIFIFTDADCYEYGFLEPFSDLLFSLRNYNSCYTIEYVKAKKKNIIYFIFANTVFHILYLTGFLTFLIKLFY